MKSWVVVTYDRVDIRTFQDLWPRYVPGVEAGAAIARAETETDAIKLVASGDGWYAAFPLPALTPRRVTLTFEGA